MADRRVNEAVVVMVVEIECMEVAKGVVVVVVDMAGMVEAMAAAVDGITAHLLGVT